jgi:hypothetical protein
MQNTTSAVPMATPTQMPIRLSATAGTESRGFALKKANSANAETTVA